MDSKNIAFSPQENLFIGTQKISIVYHHRPSFVAFRIVYNELERSNENIDNNTKEAHPIDSCSVSEIDSADSDYRRACVPSVVQLLRFVVSLAHRSTPYFFIGVLRKNAEVCKDLTSQIPYVSLLSGPVWETLQP